MVAKISLFSLYAILLQRTYTQSIGCAESLPPYNMARQTYPALVPSLPNPATSTEFINPGSSGIGLSGPSSSVPGLSIPGLSVPALSGPDLGNSHHLGCGYGTSTPAGFYITSISPNAPTGLTILSENSFRGYLTVKGSMPFISSVSIDGVLPSCGMGAISYACGNGIGIFDQNGGLFAQTFGPTHGSALADDISPSNAVSHGYKVGPCSVGSVGRPDSQAPFSLPSLVASSYVYGAPTSCNNPRFSNDPSGRQSCGANGAQELMHIGARCDY